MFTWQGISAIAEIIGAAAVVVSLVYLAVQSWWGRQRIHVDPEYAALVDSRLAAVIAKAGHGK